MYKNIKNLRENKDLTQKEVAEILNVSQTTYSRYENGKLNIPSTTLIRLSKFYNISVDYLLGIEKDNKSKN